MGDMKMKKIIALLVLILFSGCMSDTVEEVTTTQVPLTPQGNAPSTANYYHDITPAEAKLFIDSNPEVIVIDVSPHYDRGHIPGAVNYYLGDGSLDAAIPTLDKDKVYIVYCHVESVSRAGAQKLVDAGFPDVYRLEGDYPAWVAAGYPVE